MTKQILRIEENLVNKEMVNKNPLIHAYNNQKKKGRMAIAFIFRLSMSK